MKRIKVTTNFPEWPIVKQTPNREGVWGDCHFIINENDQKCDYWVVFEDLLGIEQADCAPQNTILVTCEPSSIKKYPRFYIKQFGAVITCHQGIKHPNKIVSQQGLPWMIGGRFNTAERKWDVIHTKDYDELDQPVSIQKPKRLSVICSDKMFTSGHAKRLEFVMSLQSRYGNEVDVFGRGIREVEDKWDAIAPYQFHIAIENCVQPHYWTEKLSDAFLAESHPIYHGCPNIHEYFPEDSLTAINIEDPETAYHIIDKCLLGDDERQLALVQQAKKLVLNEYQLFPMLQSMTERMNPNKNYRGPTILYPQSHYNNRPIAKIRREVSDFLRKI